MFKSLKNPLIYTFVNVGGSLLPLLVVVLYAKIIDEKCIPFYEVAGRGEITIICIPLCISILYTLYQYKKEIGISKVADIFFIITVFFLVVSVGLYAYGIKASTTPKMGLVNFSMLFLAWTVLSMIVSKHVEDETVPTLKKQRNEEQDNLESKFNQTRN